MEVPGKNERGGKNIFPLQLGQAGLMKNPKVIKWRHYVRLPFKKTGEPSGVDPPYSRVYDHQSLAYVEQVREMIEGD